MQPFARSFMRVAWPHSPAHRLAVLSWLPVHFIIGLLNPYANDVPTSVLGVAVTLTANRVCQHCKKTNSILYQHNTNMRSIILIYNYTRWGFILHLFWYSRMLWSDIWCMCHQLRNHVGVTRCYEVQDSPWLHSHHKSVTQHHKNSNL